MAVSGYGDSYAAAPTKKKTVKRRTVAQKRAARTTDSSRRRFDAHHPNAHSPAGGTTPGAPPAAPGPLSGPLHRQAADLANLRYGGAEASLNARGQAIHPWYEDFRRTVTAGNATYTAQSAPVVAQAQAQQKATGQVAPDIDVNTPAGKDAQLAAQAREALQGLGVTTLNSIVNANQGYAAGRLGVSATAEAGAQADLARDRKDLATEKGTYQSTALEDLKTKQHTAKLEDAAFGLDVEKVKVSAASDAADRRADARKTNQTVNKYGYTNKDWKALGTAGRQKVIHEFDDPAGGKKSGGFTPLQRSKTKSDVRRGVSLLSRKLKGKTTAPAGFWEQAYSALVNEGGPGLKPMDPLLARAVIQIAKGGKAGPKIARRIKRDYGVHHLPHGKPFHVPAPYVLPNTDAPHVH